MSYADFIPFPATPNDLSDNPLDWSEEKWAEIEAQDDAKEARKASMVSDEDIYLWLAEEEEAKIEANLNAEARYWEEIESRLLAA